MKKLRVLLCTMLLCMCSILPTQASEAPNVLTAETFEIPWTCQDDIMSIYENFMEVSLYLSVDDDNTLYYGMSVTPYPNTSYFSGILRLYDGAGNVLKLDSVRETESPYVSDEFTYSAVSGEQYQVGFTGYVYRTPGGYGEYVDVKTTIQTVS